MLKIGGKPIGLLLVILWGLATFSTAGQPEPAQAQEICQSFTQTNFKICGKFLDYWKANGDLTQQGYPISAVFEEKNAPPPAGDGLTHSVQYFERARFELHPENQPPNDVQAGLLGTEQYKSKYPGPTLPPPINPAAGQTCQNFELTGFKVCGRFLDYWKANGDLTRQGLPISPVFEEQNPPAPAGDGKRYQVQYFQRARFEFHPENQPPYDVLLGLLGAQQYLVNTAPPPTIQPTPGKGLPGGSTQPPPTPTPPLPPANGPVQPYACLPGFINVDDTVQACVDNSSPASNGNVTVYGRLILGGRAIPNTKMITSWKYPKYLVSCKADGGDSGVASCALNIGDTPPGTTVVITVYFNFNSQLFNGSTTFTTQ